MRTLGGIVIIAAVALAGCGTDAGKSTTPAKTATSSSAASSSSAPESATTTEAPAEKLDAAAVAKKLKGDVDGISKVVVITEDNDPNDLIGRPNGYESAAVLYDPAVECTELGATCGATVEVWPSETDATERSEYIQDTLKSMKMLGTEYHYQDGATLLRVTGELKPSRAKKYEAAFSG